MVIRSLSNSDSLDSLERYYLGEDEKVVEKEEETESKLKLPESDGVVRIEENIKEEEGGEQKQQQQQHYCHECQKGFRSGKAYGGHMSSAHSKAARECQNGRGRGRGRRGSVDADADDGTRTEFPCKHCEKVFETNKSLYGHMRSHSDRPYRGMNPPAASSSQPEEKKQKILRSRRPHHNKSLQLEDKEMSKMASSSFSSQSENHQLLEGEEDHGRKTVAFHNYNNTNPVDSTNLNSDSSERNLKEEDEDEDEEESSQPQMTKSAKRITEKKEKEKCNICKKVFANHRALGGHMSSHNRHENNTETLNHHDCRSSSSLVPPENQSNNNDNHHHRCHSCHQSFPSGRALGGHMRLHYQKTQQT